MIDQSQFKPIQYLTAKAFFVGMEVPPNLKRMTVPPQAIPNVA